MNTQEKINALTTEMPITKNTIEFINIVGTNHRHVDLMYSYINSSDFKNGYHILEDKKDDYFYRDYETHHPELTPKVGKPFNKSETPIYKKCRDEIGKIESKTYNKEIDLNKGISLVLEEGVKHTCGNKCYSHLYFPGPNYRSYDEFIHIFHNTREGGKPFRWGLNHWIGKPTLIQDIQNRIKESQEPIEYTQGGWENKICKDTLNSLREVWACVEAGLYDEGMKLINFNIKIIKDPKLLEMGTFRSPLRRLRSNYFPKALLHLKNNEKEEAYKCFENITSYFQAPAGAWCQVSGTRCLEAAIEMYRLKPTEENKKRCIDFYFATLYPNYIEGGTVGAGLGGPWEALKERIIITHMLKKYVL